MALAMVEGFDFAKYASPRVARNLVDDLHRVLQLRVDVHARLHRSVSALAKHLTSQFVQFCNDGEKGEEN